MDQKIKKHFLRKLLAHSLEVFSKVSVIGAENKADIFVDNRKAADFVFSE